MSDKRQLDERRLGRKWRKLHLSGAMGRVFKDKVRLNRRNRVCLKDSFKSSIWSLELEGAKKTYPIILKIFKSLKRQESAIELHMYRKAGVVLRGLMPDIYHIERKVDGGNWWVCMERGTPVKGQLTFTPRHFLRIVPALAELHARTYNHRFDRYRQDFADWLPMYMSGQARKERKETNLKTSALIEEAMRIPRLKELIKPVYAKLQRIMNKGPVHFPEVVEAGQSIVHSDLQTANMCCSNIGDNVWDIRFIDWEGARYAPCWFDMVNMIGIFFAYRADWRPHEESLTAACARLYSREMERRGIVFRHDPVKLYRMAYLQRILEKSLYLQLQWEIHGIKKGVLLPGFLQKINQWML